MHESDPRVAESAVSNRYWWQDFADHFIRIVHMIFPTAGARVPMIDSLTLMQRRRTCRLSVQWPVTRFGGYCLWLIK